MLQRKTPLRSKPKPGGQRKPAPLAKGKGLTRKPLERKPPTERKPIERKPLERKPIERKPPAERKPIERKPIERKPLERKPIERKPPAERKPLERKLIERKPPAERKPIERKPLERKPHPQRRADSDAPPKPKPRPKPKPLREGEIGEAKTRKLIRKRSGGVCEICGSAPATDAAHRKPRSGGGLWSPSNLIDACHGCHMGNHAHPVKAKEGGWHLPSWSNPLLVPTRLIIFGVAVEVLLDDDGGFTEVH